jgi:RNA polymerase sigma factor (sigma-70 family)
MDDNDYIAQVLSGNKDAFSELVRRHHRRLYYYVAGKLAGSSEAEDVVQKSFVTAFHSLMAFDGHHAFFDWLRGIALNHCRNEWKQHARRARLQDRLLEVRRAELQLGLLEKPEASDERRLAALRRCIEGLSETEQKLVNLRFVEELPMQSIGATLGKTGEAARLLLFRIRARLADCIKRRIALAEVPQ